MPKKWHVTPASHSSTLCGVDSRSIWYYFRVIKGQSKANLVPPIVTRNLHDPAPIFQATRTKIRGRIEQIWCENRRLCVIPIKKNGLKKVKNKGKMSKMCFFSQFFAKNVSTLPNLIILKLIQCSNSMYLLFKCNFFSSEPFISRALWIAYRRKDLEEETGMPFLVSFVQFFLSTSDRGLVRNIQLFRQSSAENDTRPRCVWK